MASKREQVLQALNAVIEGALPFAAVKRNLDKPEEIPPGGLVILRDGDPGEPEVLLSPLTYIYTHRIPIDVAAYESLEGSREEVLDQLLCQIGAAVDADPTLGGLCDFAELEAPVSDDNEVYGAASSRWAEAAVNAVYDTSNPLAT